MSVTGANARTKFRYRAMGSFILALLALIISSIETRDASVWFFWVFIIALMFSAYWTNQMWHADDEESIKDSSGSTAGKSLLYSGRDHDTIRSGQFTHYDFSIGQPAVLDYTVDALTGGPINVLLTTQDERDRFEYRGDIRVVNKGSDLDTGKAVVRTRVNPGEYSIIVDNTGRVSERLNDDSVEFEIEYEVRE